MKESQQTAMTKILSPSKCALQYFVPPSTKERLGGDKIVQKTLRVHRLCPQQILTTRFLPTDADTLHIGSSNQL